MRLWLPLSILSLWGIMAIIGPLLPLTPNTIDLPHILIWTQSA